MVAARTPRRWPCGVRRGAPLSVALAALGGCAPLPPVVAGPLPTRMSVGQFLTRRVEGLDQVELGDFGTVSAVAVSARRVFAASPGGLAVFDRRLRLWYPPLLSVDGYPSSAVSLLALSPSEEQLWMGAIDTLVIFRPDDQDVAKVAIPGLASAIIFDKRTPQAGPLVLSDTNWYRVALPSLAVSAASIADLPPAEARGGAELLSALEARVPLVTQFGNALTSATPWSPVRVASGAVSPDGKEAWLGTDGSGLFRLDLTNGVHESFPFGPRGGLIDAITTGPNGIWMVARSPLVGSTAIVATTEDFSRQGWVRSAKAGVLDSLRARAISVRGKASWIVANDELIRVREADQVLRFTGLSDRGLQVLSVLAGEDGAWVGTNDGLVFASDSTGATTPADLRGARVVGIEPVGDALYLATDRGLYVRTVVGTPLVAPASAIFNDPRLDRPMVAVTRDSRSVVVLLRNGELLEVDVRARAVAPAPIATIPVTTVGGARRAMITDEDLLLVASGNALYAIRRRDHRVRILRSGAGLPGHPNDVTITGRFAWIATTGGLVRIARDFDGQLKIP